MGWPWITEFGRVQRTLAAVCLSSIKVCKTFCLKAGKTAFKQSRAVLPRFSPAIVRMFGAKLHPMSRIYWLFLRASIYISMRYMPDTSRHGTVPATPPYVHIGGKIPGRNRLWPFIALGVEQGYRPALATVPTAERLWQPRRLRLRGSRFIVLKPVAPSPGSAWGWPWPTAGTWHWCASSPSSASSSQAASSPSRIWPAGSAFRTSPSATRRRTLRVCDA
jgi:hypothetical protein